MKKSLVLVLGCVFCGLSVALGAFGAHAWKPDLLAMGRLDTFETAVRYQMYHGLALLLVGALMNHGQKQLKLAAWLFTLGIVCFSGSLYLICLTITTFGFVTPIGGVLFLTGWITLAVQAGAKRGQPAG